MSCSACGNSPCLCVAQCSSVCPEVIEKSATNINLSGIGVYDSELNDQFQFRGVASANSNIAVTLDNVNHVVLLTLSNNTFKATRTFANAAARALATPDFEGQIGIQLDTEVLYIAETALVGSWYSPILLQDGASTSMLASSTLNLTAGQTLTIFGNGTLSLQSVVMDIGVNGSTITNMGGDVAFLDTATFGAGTTLDLDAGSTIHLDGAARIGGALIPINNLVGTTTGAGSLSGSPITQFLSVHNTIAYVAPTGTLSRATFDEATVTLPQLAQRVAALITDLKATLKPT